MRVHTRCVKAASEWTKVLDDVLFTDFKELGVSRHLVRTSWDSPRGGFTEKHIKKAMAILNLPVKTENLKLKGK
ncbi:MAG: hypothetical protein IKO32_00590 [Lachnospiraceae bacterium]|nr:hypothetical protein [Lachnospiraceae bacterium]